MMSSVKRLAINIVTMLLVFFITKGESVSINIVCKRKNILSNTTYINWAWVMKILSKKQIIQQC
jgi:hypothetical protein